MVQKSGINSPVEEKPVEIPLFFNGFIDPKGANRQKSLVAINSRNLKGLKISWP